MQPYDTEKGAGTMNPHTFLRAIGPEPWSVAYVEPCRRPTDGRFGDNPNRAQHYYQYQVIIKPSPDEIQEKYLTSLEFLGINPKDHDIRFVEDNWESPTLGAWGVGWEVWLDGMEVTQFTYFQQCGGIDCNPIPIEITYGLERIAMFLQDKESIWDLNWNRDINYSDIWLQFEKNQCSFNFSNSNPENIDFPIPGNDDARRAIDLYCNLIKETIDSAKNSIPAHEKKQDAVNDNKKDEDKSKTIQELDREKLEQKFSKETKEKLN